MKVRACWKQRGLRERRGRNNWEKCSQSTFCKYDIMKGTRDCFWLPLPSLSGLLSLPALLEANCYASSYTIETHTARSREKPLAGSLNGAEDLCRQPMEWAWAETQPVPF